MIELVVAGVTFAIAGWALGARAYERNLASRTFERYATTRQLRFVPGKTGAERTSPRILGSADGVDYVVDLYRLDGRIRTRVSCGARGPAPLLFATKGAFTRPEPHGRRTDHPALDEAYVLHTASDDDAAVLRDVAPLLLFLARRDAVWLQSNGTRVSLSWDGVESHPPLLDAARDALVRIADCHRPETPYR